MLEIQAIPAFQDNYIWLITQKNTSTAWVVDPGEASPVLSQLTQQGLTLSGILLTHHHADHIGGVAELVQAFPQAQVFGNEADAHRLPSLTRALKDGDVFELLGCRFTTLEVPGHTLGHLAFFSQDHQPPLLFCGDTLFAGGCGRLFEGSAEQMAHSLQRLAALPDTTQVYAAHEYTLNNLKFALMAEPDNAALQARYQACEALRAAQQATLPSDLALEKATNPFLRCHLPSLQKRMDCDQSVSCFASLRAWKDRA